MPRCFTSTSATQWGEQMKEWYLQKGSPYFYSAMERDEFDAYLGRGAFREVLETSPIAGEAKICKSRITEEGKSVLCVMQNRTNDSVDSTGMRQLLTEIGTMAGHNYVRYKDEWYIVSSDNGENGVYEKSVLWKCNIPLRFISPITGEIAEYPVYMVNATKYSSGEKTGKNITIESSQFSILIPYNEETIKLRNGTRFLVDLDDEIPTAYKVTQIDTINYRYGTHALLMFMAVADEFNAATDDAASGVADRYTPQDRLEESGEPPIGESQESWWD